MDKIITKTLKNNSLEISIIPERGMDIKDIFWRGEKMSWTPVEGTCRTFENHNFLWEGDWDRGFFAAMASLGPEVFGTPDEKRSVHGTGAYSCADMDTLVQKEGCLMARVPIRGYAKEPEYEKQVTYMLTESENVFIRIEETTNLTEHRLHIDDGYHMQLAGDYMKNGGWYVLPVDKEQMLLRDSAPKERNPKEIYPFDEELDPIRCYQYVPNAVEEIRNLDSLKNISVIREEESALTAEMLVNADFTKGILVVRPLKVFPRSLLAKRTRPVPMYALEVCKTRPNSIAQNAIDGELMYLDAKASMKSWVAVAILTDQTEILHAKALIEKAM